MFDEMRLEAVIAGGLPERVVATLRERHIGVRLISRGKDTTVELPRLSSSNGYDIEFDFPKELNGSGYDFRIVCCETGGATSRRKLATIICGSGGKALSPYYKDPIRSEAWFSVPVSCASILAEVAEKGSITIFRHEVGLSGRDFIAWIKTTELWTGETVDELPKGMSAFREAAAAAVKRCGCLHCNHTHFASTNGNGYDRNSKES
jgi:hypothetical protein